MKNLKHYMCISILLLMTMNTLLAQDPILVSDYYEGAEGGISQWNNSGILVNGSIVLPVIDATLGEELGIISNGTMSILKDINPNGNSNPQSFRNVNGKVLFAAFDDVNGNTVWQTDGTEAGTTIFFDPDENDNTSWKSVNGMIIGETGHLYFVSDNNLFRTDGTTTTMITSGVVFTDFSNFASPLYCTYEDGVAYLKYDSASDILSLFKATDTDAVLLGEIPDVAGSDDFFGITEVAAGLMFSLSSFTGDYGGLYVFNKTDASIQRMAIDGEFPTIIRALSYDSDKQFAYLSGKGYYSFTGVENETEQLLDAGISTFALDPFKSTFAGEKLIFQTEDLGFNGHPVGITDGTAAGTSIIFQTEQSKISNFIAHGDKVFVASGAVNSSTSDINLYDVTTNTHEVVSTFDGEFSKDIQLIGLLGDQLYFSGRLDNAIGMELYRVDVSSFVVNQEDINQMDAAILLTDTYGEITIPDLDEKVIVEIYDIDGRKLNSFTTTTNTKFDIHYPTIFNIVVFNINDTIITRKYVKK